MSDTREPTLRRGDVDADGWVEYLQRLLLDHGFDAGTVTGEFDDRTLAAVRAFQDDRDLLVDGIVGNQTWAALRGNPAETPSTDGREPHSFHESGAEARWFLEAGAAVATTPDGEVLLLAANVGDQDIGPVEFVAPGTFVRPDGLEFEVFALSESTVVPPGGMFSFVVPEVFTRHGAGTYRAAIALPEELGGDRQEFTFTLDGDPPDQLLTAADVLLCPHGGRVTVTPTSGATLGTEAPMLLITDPTFVAGCPNLPSPCLSVTWATSGGRTSFRGVPVLTRAAVGICSDVEGVPAGPVVIAT